MARETIAAQGKAYIHPVASEAVEETERGEDMTVKKKATTKAGPSMSTIRKHLRELRTLVDTSKDPTEQRIAYAMETAIRWATEDTTGWGRMRDEAILLAQLLRKDLEAPK